MFNYINDDKLRIAVSEGYAECKREDNFSAFARFLDSLDMPPALSMQAVVEVLRHSPPLLEGLELGTKRILAVDGMEERRTAHIVPGDEGIRELNFKCPHPYEVDIAIAGGYMHCYSILGRNTGMPADGNPLIYSLKRIKNWRLASATDFSLLLEYFISFTSSEFGGKVFSGVDCILPVPSSSNINAAMVSGIHKYVDATLVTFNDLKKQDVDTAYGQVLGDSFEFFVAELFPGVDKDSEEFARKSQKVYGELMKSKEDNEKANTASGAKGNPFSIKYVKPQYRDIFDSYIQGSFADGTFTGKTVLVVDDSISTGKSLKVIVERFVVPQRPKEIRALTLLSPLPQYMTLRDGSKFSI
jgi:hypothetical protein